MKLEQELQIHDDPDPTFRPTRSCTATDLFMLSGGDLQCGNCGAILPWKEPKEMP